jgi:hypothetical protein
MGMGTNNHTCTCTRGYTRAKPAGIPVPMMITKLSIKCPAFDPQDEVVQDDATVNKHDGPVVAVLRVDLNPKLLETAFQKTN